MTSTGRLPLSASRLELLRNLLRAEGIERSQDLGVVRRQDPACPVPLTAPQSRMWFLDHFTADAAAYVISAAVRVHGPFDLGMFARACEEVVRRHESLRTVFLEIDGRPFQQVRADLRPEVTIGDLRGVAADAATAHVQRRHAELAGRPFDLTAGPLLRMELLRLGPQAAVVLLSMHHIVSDQWSMSVLMRELMHLYSAFASGGADGLPELAVQYPDFAVWQQKLPSSTAWQADLAYWVKQLQGAPAETGLPTDRPRPVEKTYRGSSVPVEVPAALVAELRGLARAEGATMFMVVAAVFKVLLSRLSGNEDIVVGTPVAGRPLAELEALIGFFVNTLVLRTDLSGNPTFREVLRRVTQVCLRAYEHQGVPFERVVDELRPERTLARTPLFQVMFAYGNVPFPAWNHGPVRVEPIGVELKTTKFDLTLSLFEDGDRIWGRLEYSSDIFDSGRVRSMVRYFQRLLRSLAADPEQRIGEVSLLDEGERREVLAASRGPAAEWPGAGWAHELFERRARTAPERVAVRFESEVVSYGELNRRANQLARRLRRLGVGRDVPVGVAMEPSVELVVGLLAVLKAGGAYLPLDPEYPRARLEYMLADSAPPVLLTQRGMAQDLPPGGAQVLCVDGAAEEISREPGEDLGVPVSGADLAYVIYTSGSTGTPKGVLSVHAGLRNLLLWMQDQWPLDGGDRSLAKTPISFDASVPEYFWPLMAGATLVVARPGGRMDSRYLVETVRREGITVLKLVPSMLQLLLSEPGMAQCTSLKYLFSAGEALPRELQDRFFALSPAELINLYGPTEATVDVTWWTARRDGDPRPVPIGFPIANTQAYVLDQFMEPVPPGVAGELLIGGRNVGRGYLNRPELTAERFVADPFADAAGLPGARLYRTGDLARLRADGAIEYLGRLDHQVKLRGFRIELGEIESVIAGCEEVAQAVVVAREDTLGGKRLVAYLIPAAKRAVGDSAGNGSDGDGGLAMATRAYVAERLPAYMVPSAFVVMPAFPLTPNGKIDRAALPEPKLTRPELAPFVAPHDDMQRSLAELFTRVLGVERVGVHDNFFEAGGHSLLAVQLASQISSAHGIHVPIREFFYHPTVAELAAWVGQQQALGVPAAAIPVVDRGEGVPLSFAQERLCLHHPVAAEEPFHNVSLALALKGQLDEVALRRGLNGVVQRHEALRTRIISRPAAWVQVVDENGSWPLSVLDLRGHDELTRQGELRRLVEHEGRRRFRLGQGPLVAGTLIRMRANENVLVLVMHHLVVDNWSYGVFVRDLCELYEAHAVGREPRLPELEIGYPDYAAWQRQQLASGALSEHADYWGKELAGLPPTPSFHAPEHQKASPATGHTQAFTLGTAATKALTEIGQREQATLFMVLMAAFSVLLSAYSGSDDIVVTYPEAGRERPETAQMIGYFTNAPVVRSDLSGDPAFCELVGQVREKMLSSYAYQGFPLWSLDVISSGARDPGRIVFNLLNAPVPALDLHGLQAAPLSTGGSFVADEVAGDIEATRVVLALIMREVDAGLRGMWLYSLECIDAQVMAVMMRQWTHLIDLVVAHPDCGTAELRRRLRQTVPAAGDDWRRERD